MTTTTKTVIEVPTEFFQKLEDDIRTIKRSLQDINIAPSDEHLTADEFMSKTKISRWKFDMLVSSGLLEYKKIGRKFYIPTGQVTKYFAGEMILK